MDYPKIAQLLLESGYTIFGVRGDDREYEIGDKIPPSKVWDYFNDCPTEEDMNGACATRIGEKWDNEEEIEELLRERIAFNKGYYGCNYRYLVGGYRWEYGEDDNEIVIEQARVIMKL